MTRAALARIPSSPVPHLGVVLQESRLLVVKPDGPPTTTTTTTKKKSREKGFVSSHNYCLPV
jgi:hypothetical protein